MSKPLRRKLLPALAAVVLAVTAMAAPAGAASDTVDAAKAAAVAAPPSFLFDHGSFIDTWFAVARTRVEHGLAPLPWCGWDQFAVGQIRLNTSTASGVLAHPPGLGDGLTGWVGVGENFAVGSTAASVHEALENSPAHLENMLGNWDCMVVGANVDLRTSNRWVSHLFIDLA